MRQVGTSQHRTHARRRRRARRRSARDRRNESARDRSTIRSVTAATIWGEARSRRTPMDTSTGSSTSARMRPDRHTGKTAPCAIALLQYRLLVRRPYIAIISARADTIAARLSVTRANRVLRAGRGSGITPSARRSLADHSTPRRNRARGRSMRHGHHRRPPAGTGRAANAGPASRAVRRPAGRLIVLRRFAHQRDHAGAFGDEMPCQSSSRSTAHPPAAPAGHHRGRWSPVSSRAWPCAQQVIDRLGEYSRPPTRLRAPPRASIALSMMNWMSPATAPAISAGVVIFPPFDLGH